MTLLGAVTGFLAIFKPNSALPPGPSLRSPGVGTDPPPLVRAWTLKRLKRMGMIFRLLNVDVCRFQVSAFNPYPLACI